MFREGFYVEVIKVKNSAATAVITVKEKTVEIKKKKITTNKWLTLEDWSSLYKTLEKALVQNVQNNDKNRGTEKKKFTKHLEIVYTFEASENPSDRTSLPTIKVGVSSLRRKSRHKTASAKKGNANVEHENDDNCLSGNPKNGEKLETSDQLYSKVENSSSSNKSGASHSWESKVEEYIPDVPKTRCAENLTDVKYVPSRKSALERLLQSDDSNEYVPAAVNDEAVVSKALDALYVPNSIPKSLNCYETYEPSSSTSTEPRADEYIPNSKSVKKRRNIIEEYQPDFTSKTMRFDNSYVPSSSEKIKELKKSKRKSSLASGTAVSSGSGSNNRKNKSRESDVDRKESSSSSSSSSKKKNLPVIQNTAIKREM